MELATLLSALVARYEAMAAAAQAQAWDELLALDAGLAPLRELLQRGSGAPAGSLDAAAAATLRDLRRRCLALEDEIRASVSTYQALLRPRLARAHAVQHAYGG